MAVTSWTSSGPNFLQNSRMQICQPKSCYAWSRMQMQGGPIVIMTGNRDTVFSRRNMVEMGRKQGIVQTTLNRKLHFRATGHRMISFFTPETSSRNITRKAPLLHFTATGIGAPCINRDIMCHLYATRRGPPQVTMKYLQMDLQGSIRSPHPVMLLTGPWDSQQAPMVPSIFLIPFRAGSGVSSI